MKRSLEQVPVFIPFQYLSSLRDVVSRNLDLPEYEDELMNLLNNMGVSDNQIHRFCFYEPEEE